MLFEPIHLLQGSNSALHLARLCRMTPMSFPGNSSLCLCFIEIDSKTFIVLDVLPCGLQYFLAFVIQTEFPSRWSKCCCQTLLPLMHCVHTSSGEMSLLAFLYQKQILFFCGYTQLYCYLYLISTLLCSSATFYFFMFCLGELKAFFPLMWNTFPCYICNATFLCFFQTAIQNLPFVSPFSHPTEY